MHEIAAAWVIGGFIIYNKPGVTTIGWIAALLYIAIGSIIGLQP
jgi:hypothetical protein